MGNSSSWLGPCFGDGPPLHGDGADPTRPFGIADDEPRDDKTPTMGKVFGPSDGAARLEADAGPTKGRPRLLAALWLCLPELIVLVVAVVAALVFALLPHSSYIWGALARSTTAAGIVIALGFPLVVMHSGRAAISTCVWCSAKRRGSSIGLSQEGAYSKASGDDFSAWWSRRWLTATLACDAAVVIVMFIATGVASTGALGVCVKKEIRQAECTGEDCFQLLNVSRVSQLAAGLPASFRFGVSSSAYQIEGGLAQSNWAAFESAKGLEPAGRACDAWERFDEDLLLLKKVRVRARVRLRLRVWDTVTVTVTVTVRALTLALTRTRTRTRARTLPSCARARTGSRCRGRACT